jgi:hypothetical protein
MTRTAAVPPEDTDEETAAVHAWRVAQLTRLGLSCHVAAAVADRVDWHDVAELVRRGCPPALAVAIVG